MIDNKKKEERKTVIKGIEYYGLLTLPIGIIEHKPSPILRLCISSLANHGRTYPFNKHLVYSTISRVKYPTGCSLASSLGELFKNTYSQSSWLYKSRARLTPSSALGNFPDLGSLRTSAIGHAKESQAIGISVPEKWKHGPLPILTPVHRRKC